MCDESEAFAFIFYVSITTLDSADKPRLEPWNFSISNLVGFRLLAAGLLPAMQITYTEETFYIRLCLQLECCLHCKITYTEEAFDKRLCLQLECCLHCRATIPK